MSLLKELHQKGLLRTLDHALATSLQRLREDTPESVSTAPPNPWICPTG